MHRHALAIVASFAVFAVTAQPVASALAQDVPYLYRRSWGATGGYGNDETSGFVAHRAASASSARGTTQGIRAVLQRDDPPGASDVPALYRRSYGVSGGFGARPPSLRGGTERCPRNRSLLGVVDAQMTCGDAGFSIPILINGDCPIVACVLAPRESDRGPFGSAAF